MGGREASPDGAVGARSSVAVALWATLGSRFPPRRRPQGDGYRSADLVSDRLEAVVVRHLGRARGQAYDQVHLGAKNDRLAGFRAGRQDPKRAVSAHFDVHENVERGWDRIRRDAEP